MTVINIESVTRTIVNKRYLPIRGTTRDVGGMSSARRRKKTVSERRIDTHNDIFSPESLGK